MRVVLTFAALFAAVALLQLSSGGLGPLDALAGLEAGFATAEIGLLGSAHFAGFFLGCWWAPRLLGSVGHARAFAACTAMGAMGIIGHTLIVDPLAWAIMRVASGLCVAGCYTAVESWLQAEVEASRRGRTFAVYRTVDLGASLAAQALIGVLASVELYVAYNVLALLCVASLLPLTLTTRRQPATPEAPRLRPGLAFRLSPLAALSVVVAGLSAAAFRMVGPVYGQAVGLDAAEVGLFLAAFVAGGMAGQLPAGRLADRLDRRRVLIGLGLLAAGASAVTVAAADLGAAAVIAAAGLFGAAAFPIYSVAAAHAHDFAEEPERVELSAALIFWFAAGAIASPLVASWLIEAGGPTALFTFLGAAHLALVAFGVRRLTARPARRRTRYVYAPRTSFLIGRLLGARRRPEPPEPSDPPKP
jgi:MFS family permease